ncbi:hypothetical protein EK21DRAFT_60990 [Setomelanomma holmii]|uniref:Uncharacterized protein n=1 Tax=Setomelanomma holmii TaxID=210430 RepID=A0A9P4HFI1_9PLEO|nr:hypothetical protein EK21DRAFT_60990 [Setomelanomma holmii]
MECVSIGQANPDNAGVGILVAFVTQSLIAVIASAFTFLLSTLHQQRWHDAVPDPQPGDGLAQWPKWLRRTHKKNSEMLEIMWRTNRTGPVLTFRIVTGRPISENENDKHQILERYDHWPAWLVGKQPAYPRQRDETSKIEDEITLTTRRLDFANRILLAGSDSQTFIGIALLISALIQSKTLTLYHMHIIYDTISLVIISNCAACICIFREGRTKGYIRLALIGVWATLFVSYLAVFVTRLQQWDYEAPAHCYRTSRIALSSSKHPYVDYIYIAIKTLYIASTFVYAMSLALNLEARLQKLQQTLPKAAAYYSQVVDLGLNANASMTAATWGGVKQSVLLLCFGANGDLVRLPP